MPMPASTLSGEAPPAPPPARAGYADVGLALALTFAAGMVDATGFLAFGGVFVSFMSGNTTRLAVALVGGDASQGVLLLCVVALFVIGAAVGRGLAIAGGRWRRPAVLLLAALLLLMAAAVGRLAWTAAALVLAAPAMGVMNAAIGHAEGVAVSPNYVTGMLARLGGALASWALGRGGREAAVLLPMWLAMLAGALAGGSAFARWGLAALAAPAALVFLAALATTLIPALRPSRSEP